MFARYSTSRARARARSHREPPPSLAVNSDFRFDGMDVRFEHLSIDCTHRTASSCIVIGASYPVGESRGGGGADLTTDPETRPAPACVPSQTNLDPSGWLRPNVPCVQKQAGSSCALYISSAGGRRAPAA